MKDFQSLMATVQEEILVAKKMVEISLLRLVKTRIPSVSYYASHKLVT